MPYYIWIIVNALVVFGTAIYIWLVTPHPSVIVRSAQFFSQIAIILFFVNINMYFIFLVIKKSNIKKIKINLTKIARKMMKWHIYIAILGTALIIVHAQIMMTQVGGVIGYFHPKMLSGYIAFLLLAFTLWGGYRRHKKSSGFRRKFHLIMAFIFGGLFMIHLFLPT